MSIILKLKMNYNVMWSCFFIVIIFQNNSIVNCLEISSKLDFDTPKASPLVTSFTSSTPDPFQNIYNDNSKSYLNSASVPTNFQLNEKLFENRNLCNEYELCDLTVKPLPKNNVIELKSDKSDSEILTNVHVQVKTTLHNNVSDIQDVTIIGGVNKPLDAAIQQSNRSKVPINIPDVPIFQEKIPNYSNRYSPSPPLNYATVFKPSLPINGVNTVPNSIWLTRNTMTRPVRPTYPLANHYDNNIVLMLTNQQRTLPTNNNQRIQTNYYKNWFYPVHDNSYQRTFTENNNPSNYLRMSPSSSIICDTTVPSHRSLDNPFKLPFINNKKQVQKIDDKLEKIDST